MADQTPARVNPRCRRHALRRLAVILAPLIVLVSPTAASARTLRDRAGQRSRLRPGGGLDSTASGALPTLRLGVRPWGDGSSPCIGGFDSDELFDVVESRRGQRTRRLAYHRAAQHGEDQPRHRDTRRDRLCRRRLRRHVHAGRGRDVDPRTGSCSEARTFLATGRNGSRRAGRSAVRGRVSISAPGIEETTASVIVHDPRRWDLAVRRPDAHRPQLLRLVTADPISTQSAGSPAKATR